MSSDDIVRALEEAEDFCKPDAPCPSCRLAAIVREQQQRIAELTTWRSMETAPKDEIIIVYWWDEKGCVEADVVHWCGSDPLVPWQSLSDMEMMRAGDYFRGWLPFPSTPKAGH